MDIASCYKEVATAGWTIVLILALKAPRWKQLFKGSDVSERTASEVAKRQEGVYDFTKEVELLQQVVAVFPTLGEQIPALPVRSAHFIVADVSNVHQEVKDVPQGPRCGVKGYVNLHKQTS